MRTDLSEEADAEIGRVGCGEVIQKRVVEGGESEARGLMVRGREGGLGEGMMWARIVQFEGIYWSSFMVAMARRDRSPM